MFDSPRQALHCCWVVDPWDRRRTRLLDAWGGAVGAVPTLWHAGQLQDFPDTDVQLRPVEEALDSPVSQELGLPDVWDYEIEHRSHAVCADLFRYLATYLYGGVYFDLDIAPATSVVPAHLWENKDWPDLVLNIEKRWLEIRVIRARQPGNPEVERLLRTAVQNTQRFIAEGGYESQGYDPYEIVYRTGPRMASQILFGDAKMKMPSPFLAAPDGGPTRFRQMVKPLVRLQPSEPEFLRQGLATRKAEVESVARADEG